MVAQVDMCEDDVERCSKQKPKQCPIANNLSLNELCKLQAALEEQLNKWKARK